MKLSDDVYTIMIFRGIMANPLQICLRKKLVKRAFFTIVALFVIQVGGLAHYVVQTSQVQDLKGLQQAMSQASGQMVAFSKAIADMKQRMLAMRELNEKLQTMFGLEPEQPVGMGSNGQGGEEFPYETATGERGQSLEDVASHADGGADEGRPAPRAVLAAQIARDLIWLNQQAVRQQGILGRLEETAGARVERWASTPSIWPVRGRMTSKFGPRISPFTGKKTFHSGVDIGAMKGKEIQAPATGKIVGAAYGTRLGNFIRIDHGYGIETTYGHLSKILVQYGQKVKRGDVIGWLGNTGKFSTGPHLHYQVAVNDQVVNPLQYILD